VKEYSVFWSDYAQQDLRAIIEYIRLDNPDTARRIFDDIRHICDELNYLPHRKRIVPELQELGIASYREILHKRWRIVFRIHAKRVDILLVVDSRQDLESILFRRLMSPENP
jgi:plasmid stabilization system protein ParE